MDRIKVYHKKDLDEEADRLRKVRWNLIKDTGPITGYPKGLLNIQPEKEGEK